MFSPGKINEVVGDDESNCLSPSPLPSSLSADKKNKQTNEKNIAAKEDDVEDQSSC